MRTAIALNILTLALSLFFIKNAVALPIDWHGVFAVDSKRINTYRMTDTASAAPAAGDQTIISGSNNAENASIQSYILKLQPSIIVNDSVTINTEITTNYGRGGFLGDSSVNQQGTNTFAHALYFQNTTEGDDLVINKMFLELFSDTGTYIVGRFTKHWGLGALFNAGNDIWDRHVSIHDGLEVQYKLGKFYFTPHITKISNGGTQVSNDDIKDYGLSALYDNTDKELTFGVLFSKRKSKEFNTTSNNSGANALGSNSVKIFDIYLKKTFGKYTFAVEVPLISGELGFAYNATTRSDYKANALLFENTYAFNDKWSVGFDFGAISGDNGSSGKFEAMYLHPNYQIANLLFRYNLTNISDGTGSIYDSYITNAMYAKLNIDYTSDDWSFYAAYVWAKAREAAQVGSTAFDHGKGQSFTNTSGLTQDDALGHEIDLGFKYQWNTNVDVGFDFGYLITGDYFAFDNTSTPTAVENSFLLGLNVGVNF